MTRTMPVLRDRELLELLADEPELLAIADAIVAGRPAAGPRHRSRLAVLLAAVAAVVAATLVAPWSNSRGGVIQKALAAVTTRSVLHVVLVSRVPDVETVDLDNGRATPATVRMEQWFDTRRALKRYTVARAGVTSTYLETQQGVWSNEGRVPTCAWIAAHPVQATRLRVSCNASGRNGATPRRIAESRPTADPALAAFLTGYRAALSSGAARSLGTGRVGGRPVFWIGFALQGAGSGGTERVAVSKSTFRPLRIETATGGKVGVRADVVTIDTVPYRPALFLRPNVDRTLSPTAGEVAANVHVTRPAAERALEGQARSLGAIFRSLPLVDARLDTLTTGYGPRSHKRASRAPGVEFLYGDMRLGATSPFLRVSEALSPQVAYGMQPNRTLSRRHVVLTRFQSGTSAAGGRSLWLGELRAARLWVSLEASSRLLVLDAAAALNKAR